MRGLSYSVDARADLRDISDFVSELSGSEDVAEAVVDGLIARCERLAGLPGMLGTARPALADGLRSTPHKGYVIFFRYVADALEIVNVLHGSRDVMRHFDADDGG